MGISYHNGPTRTFTEAVPGALTGQEDLLVEVVAGGVQLFTSGVAIGTVFEKMQGSNDVAIRLLGGGKTTRMIQNGAVTPGTQVKAASGGQVAPLAGSGRSVGVKVYPLTNGAAGDVIEVLDCTDDL